MFRKTMIALAATIGVAGAALIPTAASAHHHHGGHHNHARFHFTVAGPSCWEYRVIETRRGLRRVLVNVCTY